jgi:SH3-like domain-containing protein
MTKLCECGCGEATPIAAKSDKRRGYVKGEHTRFLAGHSQRMRMSGQAASHVQVWTPATPLSEMDIAALVDADEVEAAHVFTRRLRAIERADRAKFVETGLIVNEVEQRQLWRHERDADGQPFHSFNAWIASCAGASRSTAYAAWKTYQALKEINFNDLLEIPHCNAKRLMGLSTAVQRDQKIIDAAKWTERAFVEEVQKLYPEQHVELESKVTLKPELSARTIIQEAWDVAMWVYDVKTREDAQENIAAYFLDGRCEREGYSEATNREAFAEREEA